LPLPLPSAMGLYVQMFTTSVTFTSYCLITGRLTQESELLYNRSLKVAVQEPDFWPTPYTYFTTGGLPPISSSWRQTL
jgi:hypothetical protein